MTAYAIVETALARLHGVDPAVQRGAFRGRIKHLQKLGLPLGQRPGKGARVAYSEKQIWQLALALELSQCGIDPTVIVRLISSLWQRLIHAPLKKASQSSNKSTDRFLVLTVDFMSSPWNENQRRWEGLECIYWIDAPELSISAERMVERRGVFVNVSEMIRNLSRELSMAEQGQADGDGT